MKITFIRPNIFDGRLASAGEVLVFALLKGLTPPDVETVMYDERLEPVPYDEPTDLLALTVETFTARRAYQIAHEYRKRGVKVVMGGFHPTFMPEEAAHFADAVVVGDAEQTWPRVVEDARAGRLQRVYSSEFAPLENVRPDYSIFDGKKYVPLRLMQFSRGCRFNCHFCSIHAFYGTSLRFRPIPEMIAEIERDGFRHILFVDDNILVTPQKSKELFKALIPLKIKWSCQVSIDVARDPELLDLMEKSGCMAALIGFESLDASNLKRMNKGWNLKWADYDTSIKRLQDAGVMIYGSFVFGWDQDTPDVFERTLEFTIRHKFVLAGFNALMPTPGSDVYDQLKRDGRMIYEKWWVDPKYRFGQATFHPRGMTADQLTEGCYHAREQFSRYGSIARRFFDTRTHLRSRQRVGVYLMTNRLLREELPSKQGKQFGAPMEMDPFAMIEAASCGSQPVADVEH